VGRGGGGADRRIERCWTLCWRTAGSLPARSAPPRGDLGPSRSSDAPHEPAWGRQGRCEPRGRGGGHAIRGACQGVGHARGGRARPRGGHALLHALAFRRGTTADASRGPSRGEAGSGQAPTAATAPSPMVGAGGPGVGAGAGGGAGAGEGEGEGQEGGGMGRGGGEPGRSFPAG